MLPAEKMHSLYDFFTTLSDPRRAQGRRHSLATVLAISAAAVLCGMQGYKAIWDWAKALGPKARERFGCRYANGGFQVPSESIIRNVLIRVSPDQIDLVLQQWHKRYEQEDESIAIDGKIMKNAIDEEGRQTHVMSAVGHQTKACYTQKKVGTLPIEGRTDEQKQTNEITLAIPLLDAISIQGKTLTADALLTQRKLANYIVDRQADYHFTVKDNQPTLRQDIALFFEDRQTPDFVELSPPDHGRIETRKIWITTALNLYLDFPHVGQAFVIERESINKKTGERSHEVVYGLTSCSPEKANAANVLKTNRGHWGIENSCHYVIDWNYDEDRCRIRTGHGPINITRLRRFAVGLIKSKGVTSVAQKMRELVLNTRLVFDYLKMTKNSCAAGSS